MFAGAGHGRARTRLRAGVVLRAAGPATRSAAMIAILRHDEASTADQTDDPSRNRKFAHEKLSHCPRIVTQRRGKSSILGCYAARARREGFMITLVLAMAKNGVIGKDGGIPWRIPDDSSASSADLGQACHHGPQDVGVPAQEASAGARQYCGDTAAWVAGGWCDNRVFP